MTNLGHVTTFLNSYPKHIRIYETKFPLNLVCYLNENYLQSYDIFAPCVILMKNYLRQKKSLQRDTQQVPWLK